MIELEQKIIQVGSRMGVVIPKDVLFRLGAKRGDLLKLRIELVDKKSPKSSSS